MVGYVLEAFQLSNEFLSIRVANLRSLGVSSLCDFPIVLGNICSDSIYFSFV